MLQKLFGGTSALRLLYHYIMGWIAAARYGFPGKKMKVIGVTGTDGKTSTCFMIAHILENSHIKVGMTTTVAFQIGKKKWKNTTHKTTLGRFGLHKMLRDMVRAGVEVAVVEVSSHGLLQSRLIGVNFVTAVITSLSREHLDYHGTMEAYRNAKGKLFRKLVGKQDCTAIVCSEISESQYFLQFDIKNKIVYGEDEIKGQNNEKISNIREVKGGQEFELDKVKVFLPLAGEFHAYNATAALLAAKSVGVSLEKGILALCNMAPIPGRLEEIVAKNGAKIFIDYAVTPDALTKMYSTLSSMVGEGKLIAVLGACGDRDQGKRPIMGEIATRICDYVYFTDEESYTENPLDILEMLTKDAKKLGRSNFDVILDRAEAIKKAITASHHGDIIVVSGMGDQDSRVVGDKKLPWSDRGEVLKNLN